MKDSILRDKAYKFALRIVKTYQYLIKEKNEYVLSKQLLRSGTAIGALAEEANQAESKSDFVHKLSISNKEANETLYWLRLLKDSDILEEKIALSLIKDNEEIIRLLISSIRTAKKSVTKKLSTIHSTLST